MKLENFVETNFGRDKLTVLRNIRQGGDNNSKGSKFEEFFAVASICKVAANEDNLGDFEISAQELAFVDDLTVCRLSTKDITNYQLKNSFGSAADWNDTISERFELQYRLDMGFHQASQSRQLLIVPCPDKAANNRAKIPTSLRDKAGCEVFRYKPSSYELITEISELRGDLAKICQSNDLHIIDIAFKLVLSVWGGNNKTQTVSEIIVEAEKIAKPNVFKRVDSTIPDWLNSKVNSFQEMDIRVEFGHFVVSYRGFQVTTGETFEAPNVEKLNSLSTAGLFMKFLMETMQTELNDDGE
jgi:hypothetical protein